jgi:hypothetical protein
MGNRDNYGFGDNCLSKKLCQEGIIATGRSHSILKLSIEENWKEVTQYYPLVINYFFG